MEKINKRKKLVIVMIVLVLIIIVGIGIFFLVGINAQKTPSLPADFPGGVEVVSSFNFQSTPIDSNDIFGSWKGTSEDTIDSKNTLTDTLITFNSDGTYSYNFEGFEETGFYKIENYKIFLGSSKDNLESGELAYGNLQGNDLILMFPQFPKVTFYQRA